MCDTWAARSPGAAVSESKKNIARATAPEGLSRGLSLGRQDR